MPGRLPPAVLSRAQQLLSPQLLGEIEKNPGARVASEVWKGLSPEQRDVVRSLRSSLSDGFSEAPRPRRSNSLFGESKVSEHVSTGIGGGPIEAFEGPLPGEGPALAVLKANPPPPMDVTAFKGVNGQALRNALRSTQGPGRVLDYSSMRAEAYTYVFNRSGRVLDHYTGQMKTAQAKPEPSQYNWEHIFAQSWNGLKSSLWRSHAFNGVPTQDKANAMRGHLPFGEVSDVNKSTGYVTVGADASGRTVAELDPRVRGDIALRALWMYTEAPEYLPADAEFMLPTMVKWLIADPPGAEELSEVQRAEQVEQEVLYYAHCPKDLVLRAFADVLAKHQDDSADIKALHLEAQQIIARDDVAP